MELRHEPLELLTKLGSAIGDFESITGLVFLHPEVFEDAQDVKKGRGAGEQDIFFAKPP